jgi:hypothetical protein
MDILLQHLNSPIVHTHGPVALLFLFVIVPLLLNSYFSRKAFSYLKSHHPDIYAGLGGDVIYATKGTSSKSGQYVLRRKYLETPDPLLWRLFSRARTALFIFVFNLAALVVGGLIVRYAI